ncbi:DUF4350 domain-containing protein [Microbacterium thalassium]|uniref:DUF4350 domain-containing protein n=1 Tax=Microbacterium thalassium TaxID=362649 RepID=A0A7X0KUN1_9MICO|nr:DUF4350 domain-containing protein [Microbacterium thalassium]MBB6391336.1 hypothetical protein [Microbacterium thalassium]GLK23367.1 hypothetical protein GCM10017607_06850 [Microbacterium thalassium]
MTATTPVGAATPAVPRPSRRRAVVAWVVIGAVLLVVGGVGGWLTGLYQWSQRDALDPDSAGPAGTRALVHILRDQGIELTVTDDRAAALRALSSGAATLALPDAPALSDGAVAELADAAADVVLLDPRTRTLGLLLGDTALAGEGDDTVASPACSLAEATRSGGVVPGAVFTPDADAAACYPSGQGYALIVHDDRGHRIAALDARAIIANDVLAEDGNAALGLNLLGRHDTVVWYVPSAADTDLVDTSPSLGELTPPWVSPVIVLLLAAGAAAAVWRGRRFGPLVAERLPVTVRASETTEGRARLYERSRDALHAADQLRSAAADRLAAMLGLGPAASASEISDAASAVSGWDPRAVRGILIDEVPRTDAELVALDERLRHLEQAVRTVVRTGTGPERNAE